MRRMKLALVLLQAVACFAQPFPRLLPWVEFGFTPTSDPNGYANLVAGLRTWRTSADAATITTGPDNAAAVYAALYLDLGGRPRIIPSLKISGPLNRELDCVSGWQVIANAVTAIGAATGADTIVIEAEGAVAWYLAGTYKLDWDKFAAGLRLLPPQYAYVWYPALGGDEPEPRAERAKRLLKCIVETVPRVTLVGFGRAWQSNEGNPAIAAAQKWCEAMAPCVAMVYVGAPGTGMWPAESVPYLTRDCPLPLLLYPGATAWRGAAERVGRALLTDTQAQLAACEADNAAVNALFTLAQQALGECRSRLRRAHPILYPEEQP